MLFSSCSEILYFYKLYMIKKRRGMIIIVFMEIYSLGDMWREKEKEGMFFYNLIFYVFIL